MKKHDATNLAGFDPVRADEARYHARNDAEDRRRAAIEERANEIVEELTDPDNAAAYAIALADEVYSTKDETAAQELDRAVHAIGIAFRRMATHETHAQLSRNLGKLLDRHIERAARKRAEEELKGRNFF